MIVSPPRVAGASTPTQLAARQRRHPTSLPSSSTRVIEKIRASPLPTRRMRMWSQRRGRTGTVTVRVLLTRMLPAKTHTPSESYSRKSRMSAVGSICTRITKWLTYFLSGYR